MSSGGLVLLGLALLGVAGYFGWRKFSEQNWMQGYRVVAVHPHDPTAYTQGLVFDRGLLHESTGQRGSSRVRTLEIESGKELRVARLPPVYFGEGLALVGERLIQLTWQEGVARIYERDTLKPLDERRYEGEGWGLAFDGTHLVMSDGSDMLLFRDPASFEVVRRVTVRAQGVPVQMLNELEVVGDEVWANLWKRDLIARIDPTNGEVRAFIDLSGIFDYSKIPNEDAVLNGIAHDPETGRVWVTGKLWPKLFEIEVLD
jgi:glutamine cyclotransferase